MDELQQRPPHSALNLFTGKGRLKNRVAAAFAEPVPANRLSRLREVWAAFSKKPSALGSLWLPFLYQLLHDETLWSLTVADFEELRTTGEQVAKSSGGRIGLEEVWRPLVAARDARGEHPAAATLLVKLAGAASTDTAAKTRITSELAQRGVDGDEVLPLYLRRLSEVGFDRAEPEITRLITAGLTSGFDVPTIRIKRAGEIAAQLRHLRIHLPKAGRALGFSHLFIERNDQGAIDHFQEAIESDPADEEVLAGLLCALIRDGQHDRATALRDDHPPATSRCQELFALSTTLTWLDDVLAEGLPPYDSAGLLRLTIAALVGDWLTYAVGRLYLLEGKTERAAEILVSLADRYPERAQWGYHAASALALAGDPDGVRARFLAAREWSGRWTIGCLLLDLDPAEAVALGKELETEKVADPYPLIVAARVGLAQRKRVVPRAEGWRSGGGTAAEDLESLRTALGEWFASENPAAMADALSGPAFAHLPFAEQVLWQGLSVLSEDEGRGQALLESAAHVLRHPRAALALIVLYLGKGEHAAVRGLFELFSWREDNAPRLVRAWSELCAGNEHEAVTRFAELAASGDVRAHHALGNFHLERATRPGGDRRRYGEQAAAEFRAALEHDADAGTELLVSYAELVATGIWHSPATGDRPLPAHLPGLRWGVALAELAGSPSSVDLEMPRFLVSSISDDAFPPVSAVVIVAALLARACVVGPDSGRTGVFADLLARLAQEIPVDTEVCELAAAGAVRHGHLQHDLVNHVWGERLHPAVALAVAGSALGPLGQRNTAVRVLRMVRTESERENRFCEILADLLEGREVTAEPPPWDEAGERVALAAEIVRLVVLAAGDSQHYTEPLVRLMGEHDLTGIVDLRASLPVLCADAVRPGRPPEVLLETVRRLAKSANAMDPLVLARCATALGDHDTAFGLWQQLLDAGDEAVRALAHQAVLAHQNADDDQAVERLSFAARSSHAPPEFGELATTLEGEILLERLLSRLFPDRPGTRERPGRHRVLQDVVEGNPDLRSALISDDAAGIDDAWWSCLARRRGDVEVHHALAVLYRERALDEGGSESLIPATAMWALLMSTDEFWQRFEDFDSAQRADLIDRVIGELLERNFVVGSTAFDAGETETPAAHLRLLDDCEKGAATLVGTLARTRIPWGYRHIDETAMGLISTLAGNQFQGWCEKVVRYSESTEQEFADRIDRLAAFVRLGVSVPTVALAGLQRCNDWCSDHWPGSWDADHERFVQDIAGHAGVFIDQLVSTGERGVGHRQENQALSRYFNLQGNAYSTNDTERARNNYLEALSWNPENGWPRDNLKNLEV